MDNRNSLQHNWIMIHIILYPIRLDFGQSNIAKPLVNTGERIASLNK